MVEGFQIHLASSSWLVVVRVLLVGHGLSGLCLLGQQHGLLLGEDLALHGGVLLQWLGSDDII